MKRITALLLACLICLALPAAIGAATEEGPTEPVVLTAFQYCLENQNADFNTLWFFQELEKATNVHVEFRMVKDADWRTQVNLLFAVPDDLPDMILRNPIDEEDFGVSQGLLLQLDDYLTEEIMPNYVSRLQIDNAGDSIPASDGHTYFIGYLMAQNVNHNGTWYVNTDALSRLDLAVPTTIDEVTDMLRAMRDDGMAYPFSASFSKYGPETIWNQFASFGVPENTFYCYIDEDETVRFTGSQPGYRACLEWLHTLYEEGLMDPDSLTQDSNLWASKVNSGEVGYFCYLRLLNTAIEADKVGSFQSILPPVAEGYQAAVSSLVEIPTAGAYLTCTCSDPVAALRWIDAQLETETMMVALNGRVGEQIVLNAEGKYEVIDIPANNGLYEFVPVTMGQFFAPGDYYTSIYQMAPHRVERYEDSRMYAEAGVLEHKSYMYLQNIAKMNSDDSIEAADIYVELQKFMEESLADLVRSGVTDEKWDAFLATADAIGAGRYIELYQNAYDDYLARSGAVE